MSASPSKETNDDIHPSNFVSQLPTELVTEICSHLSSVGIACLALTCRMSLYKIGRGSLLFSKDKDCEERKELLDRVSQSFPAYYFCHECFHLHQWTRVDKSNLSCVHHERSSFWVLYANINPSVCPSYAMKFAHLQLAMRRVRYGPEYGIPLESLSHFEILQPESRRGVTTLISIEPRACPRPGYANRASLCLRIQQWATTSASSATIASLLNEIPFGECLHASESQRRNVSLCYQAKSKSPPHFNHHCDTCHSIYEFQFQHIQDGKAPEALIMTKWLDLGEGLDPKDPLWLVHNRIHARRVPYEEVGSVRWRFERQPGLSHADLTNQNRLLLKEEIVRQRVNRRGKYAWLGLKKHRLCQ
jgi:hypothetical protein